MAMGRFWIMHLYSCLSYSDLELIYSKCRQWGLKLQSSNAWGDCFEKTEGAETQHSEYFTNSLDTHCFLGNDARINNSLQNVSQRHFQPAALRYG